MYDILSTLLKYLFITVIYLFIYGVIRLIYLDIHSLRNWNKDTEGRHPYLKLINRRDSLSFKVDESYIIDGKKRVGRHRKNNICIQDPYLSNEHAEILIKDGECFLKDLGSTNGTMVNGASAGTDAVRLSNNDRLRLGQLDFLFVTNMEKGD